MVAAMARRTGRRGGTRKPKEDSAAQGTVDEREWADWWKLREELGKRLGGRDATGVSDPDVLDAARTARDKEGRRKR